MKSDISVRFKSHNRPLNPGEVSPLSNISGGAVRNRVVLAQIKTIDNRNGIMGCDLIAVGGGISAVTVPPLWMSFADPNTSGGASWGRYMPHENDVVKIAYDMTNKPHVIGYEPRDANSGSESRVKGCGWPGAHELYLRASKNPDDKVEQENGPSIPLYRFAQFEPLDSGEYDFMSSGGAYIRGFRDGKLYMAGGSASISLNDVDMSTMSSSQLFMHSADISEFRFGHVRRVDITGINAALPGDTLGLNREFRAVLRTSVVPNTVIDCASLEIGNVTTSSKTVSGATVQGIIDNSLYGQPLRYSYRAHNPVGLQVHRTTIDAAGNWKSESDSPGAITDFTYPIFKVNANTSVSVVSPLVDIKGTNASPSYPTILSTPYRSAEDALITELARQIDFLSAQLLALSTGLAASSAAITGAAAAAATPVTNGTLAVFLAGLAPSVAVQSAVAPTVAAATVTATSFKASSSTYLSTSVKNG